MIDFFLNDRSLHGQFTDPDAFLASLRNVLEMRCAIKRAGFRIFADKGTAGRPVTDQLFFSQVVQGTDIAFRRVVRTWLSKAGPFWQQVRGHDDESLFGLGDEALVDSILAEAAWRSHANNEVGLISFNPSDSTYSPVVVTSHDQDPPTEIPIHNEWERESLVAFLAEHKGLPSTWPEWYASTSTFFENLVFGEEFADRLEGQTFSRANAGLAIRQLEILDRYVACRRDPDRLEEQHHIERNFFSGGRDPWFSPSSDTDLRKYNHKMMFRLPGKTEKTCCHWHGKLSHNHWRLHFDDPNSDPICVVYLGYKLARK